MEGKLMKASKRLFMLALVLVLTLELSAPAMAVDRTTLQSNVTGAATYMYKTVTNPQVGSIGGEWAVIGLARSGCDIPDTYYQDYYATVENYVVACKGVLHQKKYTEYSRVILALTAIGKDPAKVAEYNLLTPLGDYDKTIWQGINGPIWALIALDSGGYAMPQNPDAKTQATRQMYVDDILSHQLTDGGWSLTGTGGGTEAADPDMTGMALQALAKYMSDASVQAAVDRALVCLSKMQNSKGGYASWGTANSESVVQVVVALCELCIDLEDSRFVKNGNTLMDNLLSYQQTDGSFKHTSDGSGSNQMASEQGLYGIVAALRADNGKSSLYRMSDAIDVGAGQTVTKGTGLSGKNADVKAVPITKPGTTFDDVIYSDNVTAIEALASRTVISGYDNGTFRPDNTMTRAEFATIVVKALGLKPSPTTAFADIISSSWYASYVGTASTYGIVNGKSADVFDPDGTITRQEAAVMVARAAKLCGMDTSLTTSEIRDVLAQFTDYVQVADWAKESMAFCYDNNILEQSELEIQPGIAIKRCEIAQMLFNMLSKANLL
jgi:hypothetical protein